MGSVYGLDACGFINGSAELTHKKDTELKSFALKWGKVILAENPELIDNIEDPKKRLLIRRKLGRSAGGGQQRR